MEEARMVHDLRLQSEDRFTTTTMEEAKKTKVDRQTNINQEIRRRILNLSADTVIGDVNNPTREDHFKVWSAHLCYSGKILKGVPEVANLLAPLSLASGIFQDIPDVPAQPHAGTHH